ncbi:MAG TPA: hypothetical protein VFV94_09845 [Polyangiaceae bacterium]|nr:hypothetical protein [Polyangiaceae bacterium]
MSVTTLAYYRAALTCLRFIDARTPSKRRFGADAQALWGEVRGDLSDADRIDVMLRDANVQWPGAFGARTVFAIKGCAEDEAFGPEWESLDGVDAAALFQTVERAAPATDVVDVLTAAAASWELVLGPFDVPPVGAADRFVVAGPSATAALIRAFAEGRDLDWPAQVLCVATPPGVRQIAALAGGLLNASKRARVLAHGEPTEVRPGAKLIISPDADPRDAAQAQALVTGE